MNWKWTVWLSLAITFTSPAFAQNVQVLSGGCGTGKPRQGDNTIFVDSAGNLCGATGSSSSTVVNGTATTVAPTYTNGTANPLNLDLSGNLRVVPLGTDVAFAALPGTVYGIPILGLNGDGTSGLFSLDSLGALMVNVSPNSSFPPLSGMVTATPPSFSAGSHLIQLNSAGDLIVDPEVQKPTYSATYNVAPGAVGIFANLVGSSTKIVKVKQIIVSGFATASGSVQFSVSKTSTAATGGTVGGTVSKGPNDSASAAATAGANAWTAVPTTGTVVFTPVTFMQELGALGSSPAPTVLTSGIGFQALTLRGVAQTLQFNTAGTLPSGGQLLVTVVWTEE